MASDEDLEKSEESSSEDSSRWDAAVEGFKEGVGSAGKDVNVGSYGKTNQAVELNPFIKKFFNMDGGFYGHMNPSKLRAKPIMGGQNCAVNKKR